MSSSNATNTPILTLLTLTILAVLIQGYHLGADDAAIYVPAIKKVADPALYPFGAQFFQSHAGLTMLPLLIGGSARLTRIPIDGVILGWHILGVFLLILASWKLARVCFTSDVARWGGVVTLAALLSVPVAGTALFIADPYVTSRTLSTPATVFAIACFASRNWAQTAAWLLLTALVHPQMAVYAIVFLLCLALVMRHGTEKVPGLLAGLPFPFQFKAAQGPAREALLSRTYFFVSNWAWYEWVGVFVPLSMLGWFSTRELPVATNQSRTIARTLVLFGLGSTLVGLILTSSPRLENFTRLQPMRALHLVYIIFFLLIGGLVGEYVLRTNVWRWLGLFVPLMTGMLVMQLSAYPASNHLGWQQAHSTNGWYDAFLWIRHNTPKNDVFAIDPGYMLRTGEDMEGFRAVAERSVLADAVKDSGAVSLFPALAEEWNREVLAARAWKQFQLADFRKLTLEYPVSWFVVQVPGPAGLVCPYQNPSIAVCRLPDQAALKVESR